MSEPSALQYVTDAALAYLPQDALLEELLSRISEVLSADTAAILLLEDDEPGQVLRARAACGIEEEVDAGVAIPLGRGFAGRIAAERQALAIDDVDHADILNPILREKGIRSLLGVPLLVEGRVIGVLHVGSLSPRHFTDEERELLQLAGDRAAAAIGHAKLHTSEISAREAAEAATRRLESLQRITDAALAYLPQDALLEELLSRITEVLSADTAAILLLDEQEHILRARAARGIEEEVEAGVTIPLGRGFAGRIAAERQALAIDDVDHADIHNPILREKGIRSLLGVPLLVEGRVIGVLHVGSLSPRHFIDDERELLQLAGDRAAVAIEHARLYEQRRLAEALQRRLLPSNLGGIPGIELASRYLPASGESLGGDWYDVFPLGRGRIVVAVGDVVGHGLAAAAVMAQLRTALRAYAADRHPPAEVVARVNHLMWNLGPTAMTTLAYAVVDPDEESLELVTAGHLPPLVVDRGGAASFLPLQGGIALGTTRVARYESRVHPFPTGTTVVLYTDGLVEVRGRTIDEGLDRLRAAAATGHSSLEALCSGIVERLVPEQRPDDIAVLAARVRPQPERLSASWPAHRESLVAVRQLLRRWLRARSATEDEIYDITVACQEACANAVEHAYRPGRESFEVEATYADRRVRVTVRDHGRWRAPRGSNRGRGLPLMHALMERVDVEHSEEGTVVVLERTLGEEDA
ncbi:MAG TPA: SpoIIE family protein phosphatase [Solirubrobacteraceae bacterium]|nr:SpoIIE family protein phosphatase [Solirubrobacteraceae bacterium]